MSSPLKQFPANSQEAAVWSKRERLWEAGYRPVAVYNIDVPGPKPGKRPKGANWNGRALADPPEAVVRPPDPNALNTGILTHGLQAMDFDIDDPVRAAEAVGLARSILGPCMAERVRTNSPRCLLPYRAESGTPGKRQVIGEYGKVEVLGAGQQFVAYGWHESGVELQWRPEDLESVPRDNLHPVTEAMVEQFLAAIAPIVGVTAKAGSTTDAAGADINVARVDPADAVRSTAYCQAALANITAKLASTAAGGRNDALNTSALKLGRLAHHRGFTEAEARTALHDACITNGLAEDDGELAFGNTFSSGWTKGTALPRDLPEDPRGPRLKIADFRAFMPQHTYIFRPAGGFWVVASVDARLPKIPVGETKIKASRYIDQTASVEAITWAPGEPELIPDRLINDGGWVARKGVTTYNLFRPATLVRQRGDASPWLDHLNLLYPLDAEHIARWLAFKVQNPGGKPNHAIVVGGPPGIGKDTILEPVKQAVGPWNFQDISPRQALGRFNGFLKAVILRISEARDLGEAERFTFYDHLKAIIAAPPDTLRVDEKHIREYIIPNAVGVIVTTNHKIGGFYLPPDDRRHYVAWSILTKETFAPAYFTKLYRWYADGGAAIVANYLTTLDISRFDPKAPPPQTEAFWQMANSARAPEGAEMADRLKALKDPAVVTLAMLRLGAEEDFRLWLADRKNSRAILYRLEDCGYEAVRNPDAKDGLWRISNKRQVVYGRRELSRQEQLTAARRLR